MGDDEQKRTGETEYILDRKWIKRIVPLQLTQLWNLFVGGGVEIRTPLRGKDLYLRTVIQPDGDMLSFINVEYSAESQESYVRLAGVHRRALEQANEQLRNIFRLPIRSLATVTAIGFSASTGFEIITQLFGPADAIPQSHLMAVVRVGCVTFGLPVVYQIMFWLVKLSIRRKISKLLNTP